VKNAVLVTQGYHLPRALFTCNSLGIESVGYSASRQEYVYSGWYKVREFVAIYKAFFDVYILTPEYISGAFPFRSTQMPVFSCNSFVTKP